jgi:hypothetical protein
LCGLGIIKCANGNESFAEFMDGVQEGSGWTKDVCTGAWDKPKEFTNNIVPFPKGVD